MRLVRPDTIPWGPLILACLPALFSMMALINHASLLPMIQQDFQVDNAWFGMLTSALLAGSFNLGFTLVAAIGAAGSVVVAAFLPQPRPKEAKITYGKT